MTQILEALKTAGLTNMEIGQLINRHLNDFDTIDPALRTDAPFDNYTQDLAVRTTYYQKGLAQAQKNEETEKIVLADNDRDKSGKAFRAGLKLYALSDDPQEVEASRALSILLSPYKDFETLNYEAQTIAMDKLIGELLSPAYSNKVSYLQMDRYVLRMQATNNAFKTLFSGRMVGTAMTETFDMKTLRRDLVNKYGDFAKYVLAMAKANPDNQLFAKALNLLNTARKYYNDMVSKRTAPKAAKEKPAV